MHPVADVTNPRFKVWISVTAFLHYICSSSTSEKAKRTGMVLLTRHALQRLNSELAMSFAPVLLRDDPDSPLPHVSPLGKRNFLLFFMT